LVSYMTLKELDRSNGKVRLVMFYVHRYIRLTIPLALITAFIIAFLPIIVQQSNSHGAIYSAIGMSEACKSHGWANLLYVNNFYDHGNDCIGVTWYTGDDMMFFAISLLVIYPMWSNSHMGAILWWFVWLIASTIPIFYQTINFHLSIGMGNTEDTPGAFANDYGRTPDTYRAPWLRFQPYLVGILLGYILHKTRGKKLQIDPRINLFCWQAAFLAAFAVVYGLYDQHERPLTKLEIALYNGLQRIAWSVSLSWVIFSCNKGYGGIVNDFLSWAFFVPLAKISFMTYLIHAIVETFMYQIFDFGMDVHWIVPTSFYFGNLMISLFIALLFTLAFESPFIKLEKLLIGALLAPQPSKKPV